MKNVRLDQMTKGWFVGAFSPTALHTESVEVAIKHYKVGDLEPRHYHRIATEITAIVAGLVRMNDCTWRAGDIILLEPGEQTDFEALADTTTVVVKMPCVPNDKYRDEQ